MSLFKSTVVSWLFVDEVRFGLRSEEQKATSIQIQLSNTNPGTDPRTQNILDESQTTLVTIFFPPQCTTTIQAHILSIAG